MKTFSGRKASQNAHELRSFIKLLRDRGVTSYLEIGARHGDTFHEIMTSLPKGSFGVAVDLPGGLWGKKTTAESLKTVVKDLLSKGYEVEYILGDSTSDEVISTVKAFGNFDAVLIDGDHTYEGVKADWENYGHLSPVVAFHDIVGEGQAEKVSGRPVEVPKLWREIKDENSIEFVDCGSKMGIGVCVR